MTGVHAESPAAYETRHEGTARAGAEPAGPPGPAQRGSSTVVLRFAPLPGHVRTARLMAVALARRVGVEEGLLDEVRLAVGEACSRAVGLHRASAPDAPVVVRLDDSRERFGVEVVDEVSRAAHGFDAEAGAEAEAKDEGGPAGFGDDEGGEMGLAVLRGLVDDLEVTVTPTGGVIRMGWPIAGARWSS
jgi:anti-sigma regulatory factor (Ser/Thr protein kinase)